MRLPLFAAALAASAMTLGACERPAAAPAEPPPGLPAEPAPPPPEPVINGVDLTQDLRALGTEPFWAVEITRAGLKASGVDMPERTAPNAGPTLQDGGAVWAATTNDGLPLSVALTTGPCSDGMSDRTYPLTAEVRLGDQAFRGCAATVEALNRTGERGDAR